MKSKPSCGTVYLVGAGPGDPGLLTLRAAELIAQAEVLVYDALASPAIRRLAPAGAEVIDAGKRSRNHAIPQDELNRLLVAKAREGKRVVRLKGGDPYVFGRGGEEAAELAAEGIPFEVVPGISSAVAAPNYAGIPVTHREHCSSFTVITGHEDDTKPGSGIDWGATARMPGTKIILMGVERIRQIAGQLLQHGMDPATPTAMVRWGTTGRQQSIEGTLDNIADRAEAIGFKAPAVTVIGGVVGLRKRLNWFEKRPLFGQRIVVTRTREQASQLSRLLAERGAETWEIPTIRIAPPTDRTPLVEALTGIGLYDWIVFTSPNGVTAFFDYFFKAFDDIRAIGNVRLAAVGPATAARLREWHLRVDAMPGAYVAREIADAMTAQESLENLRVLVMRAEVANPDLPRRLEELGAIVDDVACYATVPETADDTGVAARLEEEGAEWVTFASSSAVENFHRRFPLPALLNRHPALRLASIGPETSKALAVLGLKPTVEARVHTIAGLVAAIEEAMGSLAAAKPTAAEPSADKAGTGIVAAPARRSRRKQPPTTD